MLGTAIMLAPGGEKKNCHATDLQSHDFSRAVFAVCDVKVPSLSVFCGKSNHDAEKVTK